jgi:hypothetical protein
VSVLVLMMLIFASLLAFALGGAGLLPQCYRGRQQNRPAPNSQDQRQGRATINFVVERRSANPIPSRNGEGGTTWDFNMKVRSYVTGASTCGPAGGSTLLGFSPLFFPFFFSGQNVDVRVVRTFSNNVFCSHGDLIGSSRHVRLTGRCVAAGNNVFTFFVDPESADNAVLESEFASVPNNRLDALPAPPNSPPRVRPSNGARRGAVIGMNRHYQPPAPRASPRQ